MSWLPQSVYDDLKREAEALTSEQRVVLTWEDARRFVASDTLELAAWNGMERSANAGALLTPWEAVARLRGIA